MDPANQGRVFVPAREILPRLPGTIALGAVFGLLSYIFNQRKKPTVVCPKCGTVKYADDSPQCSCGGHFENIDDMKWG